METPCPAFNVNGRVMRHDAEPDTPLLWVLREQLGLTGTKYGCGVAQCGSCTVHIDGAPVRSCVLPVSAVRPTQKITTIEGLSPNHSHALQKAWMQLDVPQCGYCQSGMLMAAANWHNAARARAAAPRRQPHRHHRAAPWRSHGP